MQTITLHDGTTVPQFGYGTLRVTASREDTTENRDAVAEVVKAALAAGYRHLDTAQSYGNERGVGAAIADSGIPHDELFITTKLSNDKHRPEDVRPSVEESLNRLGIEKIDLFLMHWPVPTLYDGDYVSTWKAMVKLIDARLVRSVGVSNFQPDQLRRIVDETGVVPTVNQVEVHPYFGNPEVLAVSAEHQIVVAAHSPLGQGEDIKDPMIVGIAEQHNATAAQVLIRWHLDRGRIVIPKSGNPDRMRENLLALDLKLTEDDLAAIDALDRGPDARRGPHPDTFDGIPGKVTPTPNALA